jgi:4-hydroxy-2-oxoglutarate aldolase
VITVSIKLEGILGPVVTTFHPASGDIDAVAFANNITAHLAAGLHGVAVAGSTGEAPLLDERERATLLDAARKVVPSDRLLVAGTGAESTRTTVRLSRQAAQHGADAVLVVAPHYYGGAAMHSSALRTHYLEVADKSPVPVVLYSIPKYMHFPLAPELVAELAKHENIVGIKDSSGDRSLLASYLTAQSDRFSVLTGFASTFKTALEMGARGGVLAVALFATGLTLEIYDSMQDGSDAAVRAAAEAQTRLVPLSSKIVAELGIPGVKAALDHVGLVGGPVRAPLTSLSASDVSRVAELLRNAELPQAA